MITAEHPQEHDFTQAADLFAAESSNRYLVDAAGYLRATQHIIEAQHFPETAARQSASVLRVIGDFAATTGSVALAGHAFEREDLAGKWRLYGKAAVAGSLDVLPGWQIQLESDESQAALKRSQAAMSEQLISGMRIALTEYSAATTDASREQSLTQARNYKARLWAISYWNHTKDTEFEEAINMGQAEEFETTVDQLFAARGLWQDVDSKHPGYPYESVENGNQLVAKAAIGALTWLDRRRLRRSWDLRTLLDVDALARGETIPERQDDYSNRLSGSDLLAAASPKIFMQLGLARRRQLDVMLMADKDEKAVGEYQYMQCYAEAPELLSAALQMAPFHERLKAVRGAHDVYQRAVAYQIDKVRSYTSKINWRAEHPKEVAAMQPIVTELGHELYTLDDPVDKLLATVEQLSVAMEVDPSSKEARLALYALRECWDSLEQMESYNELLPEVAVMLKAHGIRFVQEWKRFSSHNGYIGYGLVDPRTKEAADESEGADNGYFVRPHMLEWLRDATRKLNELHGEQRFVLEELPETKQGAGDYSHETEQRVRITGSWRNRGLSQRELVSAEGAASYLNGSLNTLPAMTERLMALQLADEI